MDGVRDAATAVSWCFDFGVALEALIVVAFFLTLLPDETRVRPQSNNAAKNLFPKD